MLVSLPQSISSYYHDRTIQTEVAPEGRLIIVHVHRISPKRLAGGQRTQNKPARRDRWAYLKGKWRLLPN